MANPPVNRLTPLLLAIALSVVASARLTHGEESAKKINFVNDIVPILTKSGCNAGVCNCHYSVSNRNRTIKHSSRKVEDGVYFLLLPTQACYSKRHQGKSHMVAVFACLVTRTGTRCCDYGLSKGLPYRTPMTRC
jgi:hypothetical protein